MTALLVIALLGGLVLLFVAGCAVLTIAWLRSRKALSVMALRLDAESQVELATMQTLSAMREAARAYAKQHPA